MASTLHVLGPVILLALSVPLLILATITSALAFSVLSIQVVFVYIELGFAILRNWISPELHPRPLVLPKIQLSPIVPFKPFDRRRDRPAGSVFSPRDRSSRQKAPNKSESFASLVGTSGPTRDFEGIGGWRVGDEREDALWMGINSRLELPAGGGEISRRHKRSLSSQSYRFGRPTETFRMTSPAYSRTRTPQAAEEFANSEGYFTMATGDAAAMSPEERAAKTRMDERRLSISSASSGKASATTLTQVDNS